VRGAVGVVIGPETLVQLRGGEIGKIYAIGSVKYREALNVWILLTESGGEKGEE